MTFWIGTLQNRNTFRVPLSTHTYVPLLSREKTGHNLSCTLRHGLEVSDWERVADAEDVVLCEVQGVDKEQRGPAQECVEDHAQRPHVCCRRDRFAFQQLRCWRGKEMSDVRNSEDKWRAPKYIVKGK